MEGNGEMWGVEFVILTAQLGAPPHHCAAAPLARAAKTKDFPVIVVIIYRESLKDSSSGDNKLVADTNVCNLKTGSTKPKTKTSQPYIWVPTPTPTQRTCKRTSSRSSDKRTAPGGGGGSSNRSSSSQSNQPYVTARPSPRNTLRQPFLHSPPFGAHFTKEGLVSPLQEATR